jgi:hypothetical protein
MLEAHKSYAFDLSKNLGAQMHQIVDSQNNILGDYNKKFGDFENRILLEMHQKFEKLVPMIDGLKGAENNELGGGAITERIN